MKAVKTKKAPGRSANPGPEKTRKEPAVIKKIADETGEFAESIINTVREPLIVLDQNLRVVKVSRSFYEFFKVKPEDTVGQLIYDLGNKQWDIPKLRELLETILPQKATFDNYEVEHEFAGIGRRVMLLNARQIEQGTGKERIILLAIEDITERKEFEARLEEQKLAIHNTISDELKLKDIVFEASISANSIADSTGVITQVNRAFLELWGYGSKQAAAGKSVATFFVREEEAARVLEALNTEGKWQGEFLAKRTDGTEFISRGFATVIQDKNGNLIGYQSTNIDVTDQRKAEQSLRESEEKFRSVFEESPLGKSITSPDGIIHINKAFCDMLGYTSDELESKNWKEITHPDDIQESADVVQSLLDGRRTHARYTKRYIHKNGKIIWTDVTTAVNRDTNGRPLFFITTVSDITERKQMEEELKKNQRFLAETEKIGGVGGWEFNIETGKQNWTEEVYRIHELDISYDPTVENGVNFYASASRPIIEEAVKRAIEHGEPFDVELEIITAKGNNRNVHAIGKADLENRRVYGFFQDITERKRLEEELQNHRDRLESLVEERTRELAASQSRLQFLVSSSPAVIYTCRASGDFGATFISGNAAEITGYSPDDYLKDPGFRAGHIHPDDRERALADVIGLFEKGHHSQEYRFLCKDGSYHWMLDECKLVRSPDGTIIEIIGYWVDITERKNIEETLRKYREEQQGILDSIPAWIIYKDKENRFIRVNKTFADVMGMTKEQLEGKSLFDLYPKEHADAYWKDDKDIIASGKSRMNIIEPMALGESTRWVKTDKVLYYGPQGEIIGLICFVLDITERKNAEDALNDAKFFIENTLNTMKDIFYVIDPGGKFLLWNRSFMIVSGYSDEEIKMMKPGDFFPEEDRTRVSGAIEKVFGEGYASVTADFFTKDGRRIPHEFTGSLVKDAAGKVVGLAGTGRDITERKNAEDAVNNLNRQLSDNITRLEASNKELDAFSYSVSHDLRAPLRAIDGFSKIVLDTYSAVLDKDGRRYLNIIRDNTGDMGRLIDDLLSFSRVGKQEMRSSDINMEQLAGEIFSQIKQLYPERNLSFTIKSPPRASGDAAMIKIALMNLLDNAVKFTAKKTEAVIEFGGRAENNENVYYIKDNGAGFDMKYAHKLFGIFQRLHSREEFEGTGVGLALVQRIIHRHGGHVQAEGKVNEGAVIYFALPLKEEA